MLGGLILSGDLGRGNGHQSQAMASGELDDLGFVHDDGLAGFHGQDFAARFDQRSDGAQADRRHVESHVLLRFGDFHDRESALRTELAGATNALRRFLPPPRRRSRPAL